MRIAHLTFAFCFTFTILISNIPTAISKEPTNKSPEAVKMIPATFADLAEKLSPAVVNISTTQKSTVPQDFPELPQFPEGSPFQEFFDEFMDKRGGGAPSVPASSLGSGFIIDAKNGYVITNNHVVRDAEDIRVTFINDVTVDAKLIGTDEKVDIAVLQIDTSELKIKDVSFGNSDDTRVGDWILAIGNPFNLGGTVTTGIVSARARNINSGPYDDYIQTDASINKGNSGGPLFNMAGEVIGINTAIFSPTGGSVGIGFAIPSALAKPVINQIIKYGRTRRGWLGVRIQKVTDEIAESLELDKPRGALVASVNEKGPSKAAGIKAGDIILSIDGQGVREMKMLPRIVAEHDIGTKAKIKYWRDGKEHTTTVEIGELEKAEEDGLLKTVPKSEDTGVDVDIVGFTLKPTDKQLRDKFNIPNSVNGVVISDIKPMSEAEKKGLMVGNVIVEINQQAVSEPQEIIDIIEKAQKNGRKSVLLLINASGNVRFVALRLPQ